MNHDRCGRRMGILASEREGFPPFGEAEFYRRLAVFAQKKGLSVCVFSPLAIHWSTRSATGYTYNTETKEWRKETFPLPHIVYDRCLYSHKKQISAYRRQIAKLRQLNILFMGSPMGGKLNVLRALSATPALRPHIPPSLSFTGAESLLPWLARDGSVLLKPQNGSHGRGIIRIAAEGGGGFSVTGRDRNNRGFHSRFASDKRLFAWLAEFIKGCRYLQQPFLQLSSRDGRAFDIRVLMQKDGRGIWQQTGMAVRIGQPG
ncbi:MAG TPA: YheC/YheD family protein, partial [Bacilli bacterium]